MDDFDTEVVATTLTSQPKVQVNEVLCFIQQKCNILPYDDLLKLCTDFYSVDEIDIARYLLACHVGHKRLPKPRGSVKDVCVRSIAAMIKICLDPTVQLPSFCAVNLARLPPVHVEHADISALILEVSALRRKVRDVLQLKEEVKQLKAMLGSTAPVSVPALATNCQIPNSNLTDAITNIPTFADLTTEIARDPTAFKSVVKKRANKLIVGKSSVKQEVKAVSTTRNVDVFVSRLHPETQSDDLECCVKSTKTDFAIIDIICNKV